MNIFPVRRSSFIKSIWTWFCKEISCHLNWYSTFLFLLVLIMGEPSKQWIHMVLSAAANFAVNCPFKLQVCAWEGKAVHFAGSSVPWKHIAVGLNEFMTFRAGSFNGWTISVGQEFRVIEALKSARLAQAWQTSLEFGIWNFLKWKNSGFRLHHESTPQHHGCRQSSKKPDLAIWYPHLNIFWKSFRYSWYTKAMNNTLFTDWKDSDGSHLRFEN